jgi:SAM-dependent methyltransferase
MWASGDYAVLGTTLLIVGELLCEAADLGPGWKVLDVATGSGNTALAAARRSCEVTAVDFVPALLDKGRQRAAAEGLRANFREGDAEDLAFPDASFDAVLSTFGVMFAPDQARAAGELLRVCRPGGRIGLASWTPESFEMEQAALFGRFAPPPPPGLESPAVWGAEEGVRRLLAGRVEDVRAVRRIFTFRYRSFRHYLEVLRTHLGPTRETFRALDRAAREDLAHELEALVARHNRADDGAMVVPSDYLEVVARRSGGL